MSFELRRRVAALLPPLAIVIAGLAAYHNSLDVPFVHDGRGRILQNEAIRHLWPPDMLRHTTRPLTDLSFAVNYALGGLDPFGYHLVNLFIHLAAGLVLFGLVRRLLMTDRLRPRHGELAAVLAAVIAAAWTAHPVQTESVTYLVQRAESLMGLCYLLTLYGLHRGAERPSSRWWPAAAVAACALGMASKPVMAGCPVMALLYDRVFLAPSWKELWRARGRLHLGLMATWVIPAWILLHAHDSQGTAGFTARGVDAAGYLATQPQVALHYLRLAVWPSGLTIDYGWPIERSPVVIAASVAVVLGLLGLTAWLLRRRPAAGFLGAWFFLTLAPSSLVPLADVASEHRMYLALAGVAAAVVLAVEAGLRYARMTTGIRRTCLGIGGIALAGVLCALTIQRNTVYASEVSLWEDVVRKRPLNARGYNNLGFALHEEGRFLEALQIWRQGDAIDSGRDRRARPPTTGGRLP